MFLMWRRCRFAGAHLYLLEIFEDSKRCNSGGSQFGALLILMDNKRYLRMAVEVFSKRSRDMKYQGVMIFFGKTSDIFINYLLVRLMFVWSCISNKHKANLKMSFFPRFSTKSVQLFV